MNSAKTNPLWEILGDSPKYLQRYRWFVLLFYIVITGLMLFGATKLRMDTSFQSWFSEGSVEMKIQEKFYKQFGSNSPIYLMYKAKDGDVFSVESVRSLAKLHRTLADYGNIVRDEPNSPLSMILEVRSLINEKVTDVNRDELRTYQFIGNRLPINKADALELKSAALDNSDFVRHFVSEDSRYGALVINTHFDKYVTNNADKEALDVDLGLDDYQMEEQQPAAENKKKISSIAFRKELRKLVDSAGVNDQFEFHYAGRPEVSGFTNQVINSNAPPLFGGIFVLIMLTLAIIFRSGAAVLWPILIIISTVIWTFGFAGWMNLPMSSLINPLFLLLIVISVADSVHILSAYRFFMREGHEHDESIRLAMIRTGKSCCLTTLTTLIGFMTTAIVMQLVPLSNFGLFASFGISAALILSLFVLPILMSFWSPVTKKSLIAFKDKQNKYVVLDKIHSISQSRPKEVLVGGFIIICAIIAGIPKLNIDSNSLEQLAPTTSVYKAAILADEKMSGSQVVDIMFEFGRIDALYDAEVLKMIESVQQKFELEHVDYVKKSTSIVTVLKRLNQNMNGGNTEKYRLPMDNQSISQLLYLFNNANPSDRRRLISDNFDTARVIFKLNNQGSQVYRKILKKLDSIVDEEMGILSANYPDAKVSLAGGVVLKMSMRNNVTTGQLQSFLWALGVISITMFLTFSSFKMGLLSMVPNLIPIAMTYGFMGWMNVPIDNYTIIVAPIILGLVVDDTVHFLGHMKHALKEHNSTSIALKHTLREVGGAISVTSFVLIVSLLFMFNIEIKSLAAFGYLSAFAIFSALLCDLFLVPAVYTLLSRLKSEEKLSQLNESKQGV